MTYRTVLIVKAAVCLGFGALMLAAPAALFGVLGARLCGGGTFPAREYAAAMLGTMLLAWFGKDVKGPDARGAILLDLLVYDALGVAVTVHALATNMLNALGWGIAAVYLFFTAGSAWVLAREHPFRRTREHAGV